MTSVNNMWRKRLIFWTKLSLQVIALMVAGMMWTFVNDWLQQSGFFADTLLPKGITDGEVDVHYVWGSRHYWWFYISIISFLLTLGRIIMWVEWYWGDHNKKVY